MNISAAELKHQLKKLTPVKAESWTIGSHGVSAQDADVWVVVESPLSGLGGNFSISGRKLAQVVSRMSGEVTLTKGENKLTLKSARAKVELEIQETKPQSLPEVPKDQITLSLEPFKKALATASAVASPNKSQAFGGVVQIQSRVSGIEELKYIGYRVLGTDSKVLTVVSRDEELPRPVSLLLNLPAAAVVQIMDGDSVQIGESESSLYLESDGLRMFASKPVQQFPNFDSLLAQKPHTTWKFRTEDWVSALKTVEPLIDETQDQGGIALQFTWNMLGLKTIGAGSNAEDQAEAEQTDPDPTFDPKEATLYLKAEYLSKFLSKAGPESTFGLGNIVRLESESVVQIVLPMERKK